VTERSPRPGASPLLGAFASIPSHSPPDLDPRSLGVRRSGSTSSNVCQKQTEILVHTGGVVRCSSASQRRKRSTPTVSGKDVFPLTVPALPRSGVSLATEPYPQFRNEVDGAVTLARSRERTCGPERASLHAVPLLDTSDDLRTGRPPSARGQVAMRIPATDLFVAGFVLLAQIGADRRVR